MLQYKPEAVAAFEEIEERFNATHDDIELRIESPNEAMTVLKTRLIKEDYPDIVGIGGDINYSNFLDADHFMDISDFEGINDIKPAYMEIEKSLEFIPEDGVYTLPFCRGYESYRFLALSGKQPYHHRCYNSSFTGYPLHGRLCNRQMHDAPQGFQARLFLYSKRYVCSICNSYDATC